MTGPSPRQRREDVPPAWGRSPASGPQTKETAHIPPTSGTRVKREGPIDQRKMVEKRVSGEVAIGQAAMGGSLAGSASISGGVSSAMPSICM